MVFRNQGWRRSNELKRYKRDTGMKCPSVQTRRYCEGLFGASEDNWRTGGEGQHRSGDVWRLGLWEEAEDGGTNWTISVKGDCGSWQFCVKERFPARWTQCSRDAHSWTVTFSVFIFVPSVLSQSISLSRLDPNSKSRVVSQTHCLCSHLHLLFLLVEVLFDWQIYKAKYTGPVVILQ